MRCARPPVSPAAPPRHRPRRQALAGSGQQPGVGGRGSGGQGAPPRCEGGSAPGRALPSWWLRPWPGACRRTTRLCFLLRVPPSLCESRPVPPEKGPGIWEQGRPDDRLNLMACRSPFPMRSRPQAWGRTRHLLGGPNSTQGRCPLLFPPPGQPASSLPDWEPFPPAPHHQPAPAPAAVGRSWGREAAVGRNWGPGSRLRRERAGALSGGPEGVACGGQAGAQDSAGSAIQRDPPSRKASDTPPGALEMGDPQRGPGGDQHQLPALPGRGATGALSGRCHPEGLDSRTSCQQPSQRPGTGLCPQGSLEVLGRSDGTKDRCGHVTPRPPVAPLLLE